MKKLIGNIVKLRAIEPEDLDILYIWENDTQIWQVGNTIAPFSKYVLREYLHSAQSDIFETKQLRLMIDTIETEATIGSIDIFDFDPQNQKAGIGILIGETAERGKGYASDALDVIVRYAFDILKLHQLYCNISKSNTQSLKLFQKHGFEITGTKKEWMRTTQGWEDEHLLQLLNK